MNKTIFLTCIFLIICCVFVSFTFAADSVKIVDQGNRLYNLKKYKEALDFYNKALSEQVGSAVINFDAGAAQFKTGDYQNAKSSFEKSLVTNEQRIGAKAGYNLGNAKYALGVSKENADLKGAIALLESALGSYKRSIELQQYDEDAKLNYELTEKKLKELKEKLKQQKQEQAQQNPPQNKMEQGEGEKEQGSKKEQEAGRKEEKPEQKEEGQKEQEQQAEQAKKEKGSEGQELKELSKEEAAVLLEGYRQEENYFGKIKDDRKVEQERKVLKDW